MQVHREFTKWEVAARLETIDEEVLETLLNSVDEDNLPPEEKLKEEFVSEVNQRVKKAEYITCSNKDEQVALFDQWINE